MKTTVRVHLPIIFVLIFTWLSCTTEGSQEMAREQRSDTLYVAAPAGEVARDRESILKAMEQVKPGGVVQFAPGTYKIGPMIPVITSDITLLGHPEGTVIRGCDPEEFTSMETAVFDCHGIELRGARQTVRNLTLEYAWHGLYVGCCWPENMEQLQQGDGPQASQPGGHVIEGNTFRYTPNGLRVIGKTADPVVVQDNLFVDVYHAIGINGGTVRFLNNTITVDSPERIPISHHAGDAINLLPFSSMTDMNQATLADDFNSCTENVIEGNTIDGYPDGIRILVVYPNSGCQENIIRNNTIRVGRAPVVKDWPGIQWADPQDSTVVGVPLRLSNPFDADTSNTFVRNNLIENNRIIGAEGVGLELINASGNLIRNNIFQDINVRQPFPGNMLEGLPEWEAANGSAIWISAGSRENELAGNSFENVSGDTLHLAGFK